jgi:hypothetical protein
MAFNAEQINIILSAQTKDLRNELNKAQRRIKGFETQARKSMTSSSKSFDMLATAAKRLAPILAAALSVRAIQNAANYAQELQNLSALSGVAASELQALGAASRTVGISTEKLADIYKDMNDRVGDFLQTGGGPMKDFFDTIAPAVGVTASQFEKLSGPDALQLFVSSLEKANLTQAEMVFYMEAMASDATALLPLLRDNGKEMNRLATEARNSGRVLEDDAVDGLVQLNEKLQSASDEIRTKFLTALTSSQDELIALADFVRDFGVPALEKLIVFGGQAAEAIRGLAGAMKLAGIGYGSIMGTNPQEPAKPIYSPTDQQGPEGQTDPSGTGLYYVDENNVVREYGADGPTQPTAGITGPMRTTITPPRPPAGGGGSSSRDNDRLIQEYERLLDVLEPSTKASREFADQQAKLDELLAAGIIPDQERYNTLLAAAKDQMNAAALEATALYDAMQGVQSSMENAFMSMVDGTMTAKDAFRTMAADIIKELYRVLVVQQLVGSFESGGGGILGTVFGALKGRASGGTVQAGQPYMTGESGRELFVPKTDGRILSPTQTMNISKGGGESVTVIQNNTFGNGVNRAEINAMLPKLVEASKAAVLDAKRRGGSYGGAF